MRFTVVCPVHNEETLLPYSLPSMRKLGPEETIFLLDRCTDGSELLIDQWFPCAKKITVSETPKNWVYRGAWIRREGYRVASNDFIVSTSADIILDPRVLQVTDEYLRGDCRLVSIGYTDYPLNIHVFLTRLTAKTFPSRAFGGPLVFSRQAWLETEDQESASKAFAEDTHLKLAIGRKYRTVHVESASIHLRPSQSFERHFKKGQEYYRTLQVNSELKMMARSFLLLRPGLWMGWRYERGRSSC